MFYELSEGKKNLQLTAYVDNLCVNIHQYGGFVRRRQFQTILVSNDLCRERTVLIK